MAFHDTINTGITPNDGQGDGLRTNIRKLHDNTKDNKLRLDALNGNNPGAVSSNGVTVLTPVDATFSHNNFISGAIKIKLPVSWNNSMMKLFIELYDYGTDKSVSLIVGGYNYNSTNGWLNTFAQIIGSQTLRNYTVRFGHDGTKSCIYIGELNSSWGYPQIAVTKVLVGFNSFSVNTWLTGWNISMETSVFQNITKTHTNNLPVAQ